MPFRPSFGVEVDGMAAAKAAVLNISPAARAVMADYIADAALIVESEARRRVRKRTGTLAASIRTDTSESGLTASIGTDVFYGRFVEFGSRGKRARPWLHPAFRRGARYLRSRVKGAVDDLGKARFRSRRRKKTKAAP